jgi:hypothetical protein
MPKSKMPIAKLPRRRRRRGPQPLELKSLTAVNIQGVPATVLEVRKDHRVKLQLDDGTTIIVPESDCKHSGGRPPKLDKAAWGQITCVLKNETIEALREGANSKHFGDFLQDHLDRYPPPTRHQYLSSKLLRASMIEIAQEYHANHA